MTELVNVVDRFWDRPHAHEASHADIFYCFRLLLGRSPSAVEWSGHSMMAGEPLHAVVASYLTSLVFFLCGLAAPTPSGDVVLAKLPEFRIYCDVSDPAVGKHVSAGYYEPEVTAIFRRLLKPGMGSSISGRTSASLACSRRRWSVPQASCWRWSRTRATPSCSNAAAA